MKLIEKMLPLRIFLHHYFINRTTNARTECYNNLAKLLQKRAFGFRNFFNYSLWVLHGWWWNAVSQKKRR